MSNELSENELFAMLRSQKIDDIVNAKRMLKERGSSEQQIARRIPKKNSPLSHIPMSTMKGF
jgi:hypothetical protein